MTNKIEKGMCSILVNELGLEKRKYKTTRENKERAKDVKAALEIWSEEKYKEDVNGPEFKQNGLADFLCDLQHFAAQNGYDFAEALRMGAYHFTVESAGKEFD